MSENRWERRAKAWRVGADRLRQLAGRENGGGVGSRDGEGGGLEASSTETFSLTEELVEPAVPRKPAPLADGDKSAAPSSEEIEVWRARCTERERALDELDRQAARLKRERDEERERAERLETALAEARAARQEIASGRLDRLRDRRDKIVAALRAAEVAREETARSKEKVAALERRLAEEKEVFQEILDEKMAAAREVDAAELTNELAETKRALAARDEAVAAWEKRFRENDENLRRIQRTAFDLEQDLEAARRDLREEKGRSEKRMREEKRAGDAAMASVTQELSAAQKAADEWREQLESLREEQRQWTELRRSEQDRFKRELRHAREAREEEEREMLEALRDELDKEKVLNEALNGELDPLRKELGDCLEKLKKETEARLQGCAAEERQQQQLEVLQGKVDLLEDELAESRDEVAYLSRQREVHEREVAQGQAQQENLRQTLALAETHADGLRSQLQAAEGAAAHFETELDSLRNRIDKRTAALRDREVQVGTLQNELSGFSSLLGERDERISSLEEHLEAVRREHLERETTLKRALAESAKNRDRLESALADAQLEAASAGQSANKRSQELEAKVREGLEAVAVQASRYEELEKESALLKDKLAEAERERRSSKQRLAKLSEAREQAAHARNQAKQLAAQSVRLRQGELQVRELQNELARARQAEDQVRELQLQLGKAKEYEARAKTLLAELAQGREFQAHAKQLEVRLAEGDQERRGLRQKIEVLEAQLENPGAKAGGNEDVDQDLQIREELGNMQNVVKIKNQQILLLRKRLGDYDDLRKRLLEADDEIVRLQRSRQSQEHSEQVLGDLKAWKDQLDRYKEAIEKIAATKDREIAELKARLEDVRGGRDANAPAPAPSPSGTPE